MKKLRVILIFLLMCSCFQVKQPPETPPAPVSSSEPQTDRARIAELVAAKKAIAPFFVKMGAPQKGDWLEKFHETGETFEEYIAAKPVLPIAERRTIYIQPIGAFSDEQRNFLLLAANYMRLFYNLPVQLKPERAAANVPLKWTRVNQYSGQTQIETTYFLESLLPETLPKDAAALISLTTSDLYPKEGWSFVFGQADLRSRVGVWSLYRLGNPEKSEADYKLFLVRTLKIAMHETGHTFSMRHCTKYECLMNGTNNLKETDRRPADVCPECLAKICWAMNYKPFERYEKLAKFWRDRNFPEEAQMFTKKAEAVKRLFGKD